MVLSEHISGNDDLSNEGVCSNREWLGTPSMKMVEATMAVMLDGVSIKDMIVA
jgi:hypothetical protein